MKEVDIPLAARWTSDRAGVLEDKHAGLRVLCGVYQYRRTGFPMGNIPHIVAKAEIAPHDMLEQSHSLRLHKLVHHIAQHSSNSIEPLIGVADIRQASLIEQNLLNDEDGDGFGELWARLHDTKAKGYDLGREEEVDDGVVVILLD
jgi:hypothetical protein